MAYRRRAMFRRAIFYTVAMLSILCAGLVHAQDRSIRVLDWDSVLTNDSHFKANAGEDPVYYEVLSGPWCLAGDDDDECIGGSIDSVVYRDLNHDGREDAVVSLFSGGSGHFGSCAVFIQMPLGPKFVAIRGGSVIDWTLRGDTVLIRHKHLNVSNSDEFDLFRIIGFGDSVRYLPTIMTKETSFTARPVSDFYECLGLKRFRKAYALLSHRYRESHPYAAWKKGFENTKSVSALVDWLSEPPEVAVAVTSIDEVDRHDVQKRWEGSWRLVQDTSTHQWFLDRPDIHEIKQQ